MDASGYADHDPADIEAVTKTWMGLVEAWNTRDAVSANQAMTRLASQLQELSPEVYPETGRLSWDFSICICILGKKVYADLTQSWQST